MCGWLSRNGSARMASWKWCAARRRNSPYCSSQRQRLRLRIERRVSREVTRCPDAFNTSDRKIWHRARSRERRADRPGVSRGDLPPLPGLLFRLRSSGSRKLFFPCPRFRLVRDQPYSFPQPCKRSSKAFALPSASPRGMFERQMMVKCCCGKRAI